ncbi:DUF2254 domain-containing protein [Draconibacterium halophilum]|uniref:DUF2254 domain-containing protein n=1 Tax=Draconibacterium halophilum TaxID=2706887 RepID=A0A6C0RI04_9BACT|nr:DUF2254 domain-containing protein [Draconibacterium halophilum]QIA09759.1 DUF2254 domain-containing protein [Draconibacterium halophilum]
MKKLLFFWKELMATFWFVPALIIGFAVILSIGFVSLDSYIDLPQDGWLRFFLVNSSDSARSILATISGAMIGVAGTVFSVTLVALTLASSQFGPRLIKNFMYVRLNQIVLGSYISTYLYCLLVLNAIRDYDGYSFIPSISILVAIFAAIVNIVLLIIFIHQIAVSIQADKVISDISNLISKQVKVLFPEKMGDGLKDEKVFDEDEAISAYKEHTTIKSPKAGYLQYIDNEAVMEIVTKNDSLTLLNQGPGSFLVKGGEIGVLHSNNEWEEESMKKLMEQFIIGKTKTSQQDLNYSIHQMVEIAARALSPGVNDPYTAIACIDNLTATLCYLAEAKFPSKYRVDEEDNLRIIADVLNFEGVLDAAFNQIRQFSAGSTAVVIKLMEALTTILNFTKKESYKKSVIKHAEMVYRQGKETIKETNDLQDLTERANKILKK